MVRIILRDDDLNVNCSSKDLDIFFEASKYYDEVILSMVPFPVSDSKLGSDNNKILDYSENNQFIKKARTLLESKNVNLSMHGVNHKGFAEFKNKRSLRYYECYYQMKYNVLSSVLEGTDEPAFYNNYVGGKFYRPVQEYNEIKF